MLTLPAFQFAEEFVVAVLLLLLPTFIPTRRWLGILGLVLSGVGAFVTLFGWWSKTPSNAESIIFIPFWLLFWAFLFYGLPRLVWQWRREVWWVSLGGGSLYGMVQSLVGMFPSPLDMEQG